jgi:hypothetical protein
MKDSFDQQNAASINTAKNLCIFSKKQDPTSKTMSCSAYYGPYPNGFCMEHESTVPDSEPDTLDKMFLTWFTSIDSMATTVANSADPEQTAALIQGAAQMVAGNSLVISDDLYDTWYDHLVLLTTERYTTVIKAYGENSKSCVAFQEFNIEFAKHQIAVSKIGMALDTGRQCLDDASQKLQDLGSSK